MNFSSQKLSLKNSLYKGLCSLYRIFSTYMKIQQILNFRVFLIYYTKLRDHLMYSTQILIFGYSELWGNCCFSLANVVELGETHWDEVHWFRSHSLLLNLHSSVVGKAGKKYTIITLWAGHQWDEWQCIYISVGFCRFYLLYPVEVTVAVWTAP